MKLWAFDAAIGAVVAVGIGTAILLVEPFSTFLFWISGIAIGYGLRIGVVNVWPRVFTPRVAYRAKDIGDENRKRV